MANNKRMVRSRAAIAGRPLLSLGEWPTVILSQSLNWPGMRLLTRGVIIEVAKYFLRFGNKKVGCLQLTITLLEGEKPQRDLMRRLFIGVVVVLFRGCDSF